MLAEVAQVSAHNFKNRKLCFFLVLLNRQNELWEAAGKKLESMVQKGLDSNRTCSNSSLATYCLWELGKIL